MVMHRIRKIGRKLRKWNQIFCDSMLCKKNMKRDAIAVLIAIVLSTAAVAADYHLYNKRVQAVKKMNSVPVANTFISPEVSGGQGAAAPTTPIQSDNKNSAPIEKNQDQVQVAVKTNKTGVYETKATGLACIKIPANIRGMLRGAPTPPDGGMKNGKLVCDVLADGKKDHPHKSDKNPKGQWGGCCYDPDEVPNPNCCYPVGSVYEKYLNNYFKNPFPHRG